MSVLVAVNTAPALPVSSGTASTALLAIITALHGLVMRFLGREIKNTDTAHQNLEAKIGKVEDAVNGHTANLARIEGLLDGMAGRVGLPLPDPCPPKSA